MLSYRTGRVEGEDVGCKRIFFVHAGVTRTREENASNRTSAARILLHPNYRKPTCDNCDIALVELVAPITRPLAKPIPLATPADAAAGLERKGALCFATGWGFMDPKFTKSPDKLQGVYSQIHSTEGTGIDRYRVIRFRSAPSLW